MITKIISGGNTGADQAGLRAARRLGIATGGVAPKGWRTEAGAAPWLGEWGLVESRSPSYQVRTKENVQAADGTVIFGIPSPGSNQTKSLAGVLHVPWIWFGGKLDDPEQRRQFRDWIEEHGIQVLNVAGNRESVNPGIGERVEGFLVVALIAHYTQVVNKPGEAIDKPSEGE